MMNPMDFERCVEEMEWGDMLFTLQAVIGDMLREAPHPQPFSMPRPPVCVPASDVRPQQAGGGVIRGQQGACVLPAPAVTPTQTLVQLDPLNAEQALNASQATSISYQELLCVPPNPTQPAQQPAIYSQGQYLSYQLLIGGGSIPPAAASSYPAVTHSQSNMLVMRLPDGHTLPLVGALNREFPYRVASDVPTSSAPVVPTSNKTIKNKKTKAKRQPIRNRPYVKKPPNAFILFMREQRAKVVAELNLNESATINTVLGQRWKSLSEEQQSKYYQEADRAKQLHSEQHPGWTYKDNYGAKIRTDRISTKASGSGREEEAAEANRMCVLPAQTPALMMEPPSATQAPPPQAPPPQASMQLPMCHVCRLPQVYRVNWVNSPTAGSTAQLSPTAPTETQTAQFGCSQAECNPANREELQPWDLSRQSHQPPPSDTDVCSIDAD